MTTLISAIKDINETGVDIWRTWKKVGVTQSLNRLYSVKGFEKGAAVLIPILELIHALKPGYIGEWLRINKAQKDLYDASLVVVWKIHHAFKTPSVSRAFNALGELVKTGEILKRYEILDFETCSKWGEQLGAASLFQHPIMQNFLVRPHRLFYLLHALCELKSAYHSSNLSRNEKREQLLKTAFHIGMIALILTENYLKAGTAKAFVILFRLLEIGTHSTSLIQFLIK